MTSLGEDILNELVAAAYDRWNEGDVEGFLTMFADDAVFAVPGSTRLSGDHDKAGFRAVLEEVTVATRDGRHRQELVCSYEDPGGSVCVFDNFVRVDGSEIKYHSAHEWILREGVPWVWMLYVHEFELFTRAWE